MSILDTVNVSINETERLTILMGLNMLRDKQTEEIYIRLVDNLSNKIATANSNTIVTQ